jgi:hypothetical protein
MRTALHWIIRSFICLAATCAGLNSDVARACGNCGCCRVEPLSLAEGAAVGDVIISEFMYNPGGSVDDAAGTGEWIEVYNNGSTPIDISGWQVGDSQANQFSTSFPANTVIQPFQALVVTGNASRFDAEWGSGINRIQVSNLPIWDFPSRETVTVRDNLAVQRDSVNYENIGAWPRINGTQGASIFALPAGLSKTANDVGTNWQPSAWGEYGAVLSSYSGENNHASPGYVASIEQPPFTPSPDAAWSMVLMPDTQNYVKASGEKHVLTTVTEWIRDHRDEFKIKAVLHEGDIVNNNNTTDPSSGNQNSTQQWQNAKASMQVLDGQVPYVMAAGNHDFGFLNSENRETQINTYFKATDNPLNDPAQGGILKGVKTPGEIQNAYYSFTAPDGRKMLVISLEWEPRPETVTWANQIAALPQFADHTAVLLTHAYLQGDNTRYTTSKVAADNAGSELWTNLVRQHENFEMVVNGHFGGDGQGYLQSTALAGNKVNQLFFNTQFETQGGNGWIQLVEFLQDGKTVRVRTYSPYLNQMRPHPQLEFEFQMSQVQFLAGDYNRDGVVDSGDYIVWRESNGKSGKFAADGNNDGVVDQLDYNYWRFRFGNTMSGGAGDAAAVPEPASAVMMLVAVTMAAFICRRGRQASRV